MWTGFNWAYGKALHYDPPGREGLAAWPGGETKNPSGKRGLAPILLSLSPIVPGLPELALAP